MSNSQTPLIRMCCANIHTWWYMSPLSALLLHPSYHDHDRRVLMAVGCLIYAISVKGKVIYSIYEVIYSIQYLPLWVRIQSS